MHFDFGKANKKQRDAIKNIKGPQLIIAGPGTGKTFTLIKRAMYLIVKKGLKPENIMIVTFTEKASHEMITRFSNELLNYKINININELYIGTFHSLCLRLVKENLEYSTLHKNFRLLDEFEQKYIIYQNYGLFRSIDCFESIVNVKQSMLDQCTQIAEYLNATNEELTKGEDLILSTNSDIRAIGKMMVAYRELLKSKNVLDFSTIQSEVYDMFERNPNFLVKIQSLIKYVMVDEYQDTNYVQECLIESLSKKHKNICVVGDDDQGLYRFRGATIRNILEFPNKWPGCKKVVLDENYRSEKDIVGFYNDWMHQSKCEKPFFKWGNFRFDKTIIPAKKKLINASTVIRLSTEAKDDCYEETVYMFIKSLLDSEKITNLNQIAFLYSSVKNPSVKKLANYLESRGINVYSPRSGMFFDRVEIKLLIACLIMLFPKYVSTMNDPESHLSDEIRKYYFSCINLFGEKTKKPEYKELTDWITVKSREHINLRKNTDYGFSGLLYEMFQFEPFLSLVEIDLSNGVVDCRSARNMSTLVASIVQFEFLNSVSVFQPKNVNLIVAKLFNTYFKFLIDGGITEFEDESEYAPSGCVSFMTIHQAKGMEFPIVIVGSLGKYPTNNINTLMQSIEIGYYKRKPFEPWEDIKFFDFWRLYYTAFSRAQNLLVLTAEEGHRGIVGVSNYFKSQFKYLNNSIDLKKFSFELIKDTNIKESYSFTSDISVYNNCSLQYKFFKDLALTPVRVGSTLFGTLVHETIEDVHKAALRGEIETITKENIENWFNMNYESITLKEHHYLADGPKQSALEQVLSYVNRNGNNWDAIKECEIPVSLVKPDYILSGTVDLIKGQGNTVELVDFKTEKKPDLLVDQEKVKRIREQLEVYAHILETRYGYKVSRMHAYFTGETDGIPALNFVVKKESIKSTMAEFDTIVGRIKKRDYSTTSKDNKLCHNCDMRHYCKKKGCFYE